MECPRCHETVFDTDVMCGKCGYRFDVEHEEDLSRVVDQSSKNETTEVEASRSEEIVSKNKTTRNEKLDAFQQKSQATFQQIASSSFVADLKNLISNGITKPEVTKNSAWHAAIPASLVLISAFILLYSLLLFIPITSMDAHSMSRIGTTGLGTFSYVLLGHLLLFTLGFIYLFIVSKLLSDKKSTFSKILSDYAVFLIPVFLVLLFAWLMVIVGLTLVGFFVYLIGVLLLLVIPLYVLFDAAHSKLKFDTYQFIIIYMIIAGAPLFIPVWMILDQASVFFMGGVL